MPQNERAVRTAIARCPYSQFCRSATQWDGCVAQLDVAIFAGCTQTKKTISPHPISAAEINAPQAARREVRLHTNASTASRMIFKTIGRSKQRPAEIHLLRAEIGGAIHSQLVRHLKNVRAAWNEQQRSKPERYQDESPHHGLQIAWIIRIISASMLPIPTIVA